MPHKTGLTLATALVLASTGIFGFAFESDAQSSQSVSAGGMDLSAQREQRTKGNAGQRGQGGGQQRNIGQQRVITPQRDIGQQRAITRQRDIGQQRAITRQRDIGQQRTITRQRDIGQQRTITRQRDIGQQRAITRQRDIGQQRAITRQGDITRQRDIGQRRFSNIRGASRTTIAGRNYSVWRGSHRVYRHGHWRTFVGLGALSAIAFGSAYYYPYAYIDAPAPYCDGLTEDGCQLQWQAVRTLEGPTEFVCVAYCPWQ